MPVRRYGGRYNNSSSGVAGVLNAEGNQPPQSRSSQHRDPHSQSQKGQQQQQQQHYRNEEDPREKSMEVVVEVLDSGEVRQPAVTYADPSATSSVFHASKMQYAYTFNTNEHQEEIYSALKDLPPLPELQEPRRVKEYLRGAHSAPRPLKQ